MKFRRLTNEELREMEKEFIEYLVVNGIVAEDWEKMKTDEPEKAERIVDLFSDVVFESTLRKVMFLDAVLDDSIMCFQCLDEKMVLVGIRTKEADLTKVTDFTQLKNVEVFTSEKPYNDDRQEELFQLTQTGCSISDGKLFKQLSLLL